MEAKFRNIREIVQHLRHPYRLFFYLALLGIIYMVLDIVEPVLAGHIMDAFLSNEVKTEVWQLGLLWLAIFILKYAVRSIRQKAPDRHQQDNRVQREQFACARLLGLFKNRSAGFQP